MIRQDCAWMDWSTSFGRTFRGMCHPRLEDEGVRASSVDTIPVGKKGPSLCAFNLTFTYSHLILRIHINTLSD